MSEIQIQKIKKTFGNFVAVEESDLTIENGDKTHELLDKKVTFNDEDENPLFSIDGTGHVGIGTDNVLASHKLSVAGNILLTDSPNTTDNKDFESHKLSFDTWASATAINDASAHIGVVNGYQMVMETDRGQAGYVLAGNQDIRIGFLASEGDKDNHVDTTDNASHIAPAIYIKPGSKSSENGNLGARSEILGKGC